jgi:hypothetical protein
MSTKNEIKIKNLLELHVPNTVLLSSWLNAKGYSYDLQKRYKASGWLESIGTGAFKRPSETITWEGGLYAVQNQTELHVHVGGLTALSIHGVSHYIRTGKLTIYLYSPQETKLPSWFYAYDWGVNVEHVRTGFLPYDVGLTATDRANFSLAISSVERAILECLYYVPDGMDFMEAYQILSGLMNLRPRLVQKLLEQCNSVKVKRLFLYMVDKANHSWFKYLDKSSIDCGSGTRTVIKNGVYDPAYQITVPKEISRL